MPPPTPPRIEGPMEAAAAPAPAPARRRRRPRVAVVLALNVAVLLVLALLPGGAAVKRASASAPTGGAATPKPPPPSPTAVARGAGATAGDKSKAKHAGGGAAASGGGGGGKKGSKGKGKAAAGGVCSSRSAEETADALLLSSSSDGEGEESAAATGSGITIHMLQEKDGKARRLTLPPAIATPSTLRHHLLAQGLVSPLQADGLKLRRRKEGSRPVTQGLSSASELRNGDVIIAPAASAAASATVGGKKTDTAGGATATGSFVPYPQYAYQRGKEAKARSFSDIELYMVTRQERAHASIVEVDPLAVGNFIGRVAEGETRVGLLFGSVDEQAPPTKAVAAPVRGRSASSFNEGGDGKGKVVVRVAAVMEVDASFQQHGPGHRLDDRGLYHHHSHHGPSSSTTEPSTGNDARSSNPDVARAAQVAGLFGLKPVGWVVARPGGDGDGGSFLNAQEVVVAARLQIEALKEAGRAIGDGLVTLAVNTTGAVGQKGAQHSVEAFQVSQQAVQMLWDGLIDESKAGPTQAVPTTSDVFVSGDTRRTIDAAFLTVPIGITEASTTTTGVFKRAGPLVVDDEALREALLAPIHPFNAPPPKKDKQRIYPAHVVPPPSLLDDQPRWLDTRPRQLLSRLSDFHLVVYLARYLRTPELQKLCTALTAFGKGAPVAAKEGAAKGVSVPPAVRALLEALCDEG